MADSIFQPLWLSAPGQTVSAIIGARGISLASLATALSLKHRDVTLLLDGSLKITPPLAKRLATSLGSTPDFWLERDRHFQSALEEMNARLPQLQEWFESFPIRAMHQMGWISKNTEKQRGPHELLDFFGVKSIDEWKERYVVRLGQTKFRTSATFKNSIAATTAWIRRGELVAEEMDCEEWDPESFQLSLYSLKSLTEDPNPQSFLPKLQEACAQNGVALVVTRCPTGCAASGATCILEDGRALLLLSGRFLSDDQFWFSFFHEAGHLILHGDKPSVDQVGSVSPKQESEANDFAQSVLLHPKTREDLRTVSPNKFSIYRFAKQSKVAPGLVVGQLQHAELLSPKLFNKIKNRYKTEDFIL